MNKDSNIEGLRERIAIAKSPEDVSKLLDEGSTYVSASEKTRRAWKHTADKRLKELAKLAEPLTVDEMASAVRIAGDVAQINASTLLTSPMKQRTRRAA